MVCGDLRPYLQQARKFRFERLGYAAVQVPARTAQQGAVGGVLYQSVLEQIFRDGRRAALKHHARLDKSIQRIIQRALAKPVDRRRQQLV